MVRTSPLDWTGPGCHTHPVRPRPGIGGLGSGSERRGKPTFGGRDSRSSSRSPDPRFEDPRSPQPRHGPQVPTIVNQKGRLRLCRGRYWGLRSPEGSYMTSLTPGDDLPTPVSAVGGPNEIVSPPTRPGTLVSGTPRPRRDATPTEWFAETHLRTGGLKGCSLCSVSTVNRDNLSPRGVHPHGTEERPSRDPGKRERRG